MPAAVAAGNRVDGSGRKSRRRSTGPHVRRRRNNVLRASCGGKEPNRILRDRACSSNGACNTSSSTSYKNNEDNDNNCDPNRSCSDRLLEASREFYHRGPQTWSEHRCGANLEKGDHPETRRVPRRWRARIAVATTVQGNLSSTSATWCRGSPNHCAKLCQGLTAVPSRPLKLGHWLALPNRPHHPESDTATASTAATATVASAFSTSRRDCVNSSTPSSGGDENPCLPTRRKSYRTRTSPPDEPFPASLEPSKSSRKRSSCMRPLWRRSGSTGQTSCNSTHPTAPPRERTCPSIKSTVVVQSTTSRSVSEIDHGLLSSSTTPTHGSSSDTLVESKSGETNEILNRLCYEVRCSGLPKNESVWYDKTMCPATDTAVDPLDELQPSPVTAPLSTPISVESVRVDSSAVPVAEAASTHTLRPHFARGSVPRPPAFVPDRHQPPPMSLSSPISEGSTSEAPVEETAQESGLFGSCKSGTGISAHSRERSSGLVCWWEAIFSSQMTGGGDGLGWHESTGLANGRWSKMQPSAASSVPSPVADDTKESVARDGEGFGVFGTAGCCPGVNCEAFREKSASNVTARGNAAPFTKPSDPVAAAKIGAETYTPGGVGLGSAPDSTALEQRLLTEWCDGAFWTSGSTAARRAGVPTPGLIHVSSRPPRGGAVSAPLNIDSDPFVTDPGATLSRAQGPARSRPALEVSTSHSWLAASTPNRHACDGTDSLGVSDCGSALPATPNGSAADASLPPTQLGSRLPLRSERHIDWRLQTKVTSGAPAARFRSLGGPPNVNLEAGASALSGVPSSPRAIVKGPEPTRLTNHAGYPAPAPDLLAWNRSSAEALSAAEIAAAEYGDADHIAGPVSDCYRTADPDTAHTNTATTSGLFPRVAVTSETASGGLLLPRPRQQHRHPSVGVAPHQPLFSAGGAIGRAGPGSAGEGRRLEEQKLQACGSVDRYSEVVPARGNGSGDTASPRSCSGAATLPLAHFYASYIAPPPPWDMDSFSNILHLECTSHLQAVMFELCPQSTVRVIGCWGAGVPLRCSPIELVWDIPDGASTRKVNGDSICVEENPLEPLARLIRRQCPTPLRFLFRVLETPQSQPTRLQIASDQSSNTATPSLVLLDLISNTSICVVANCTWAVMLAELVRYYAARCPLLRVATQCCLQWAVSYGLTQCGENLQLGPLRSRSNSGLDPAVAAPSQVVRWSLDNGGGRACGHNAPAGSKVSGPADTAASTGPSGSCAVPPTLARLAVPWVLWARFLYERFSGLLPTASDLLLGWPPPARNGQRLPPRKVASPAGESRRPGGISWSPAHFSIGQWAAATQSLSVESLFRGFFDFYASVDWSVAPIVSISGPVIESLPRRNNDTGPSSGYSRSVPSMLNVRDPYIDRNLSSGWSRRDVERLMQAMSAGQHCMSGLTGSLAPPRICYSHSKSNEKRESHCPAGVEPPSSTAPAGCSKASPAVPGLVVGSNSGCCLGPTTAPAVEYDSTAALLWPPPGTRNARFESISTLDSNSSTVNLLVEQLYRQQQQQHHDTRQVSGYHHGAGSSSPLLETALLACFASRGECGNLSDVESGPAFRESSVSFESAVPEASKSHKAGSVAGTGYVPPADDLSFNLAGWGTTGWGGDFGPHAARRSSTDLVREIQALRMTQQVMAEKVRVLRNAVWWLERQQQHQQQ